MNYPEAMDYILSFTDFERSPAQALAPAHYNLDRVRVLLELLGNPEQRFNSIHIAGTKGKGSTAAMIASALQCAGFKTGFFSSPHLHSFRERIRVDGELIREEDLARAVEAVKPQAETIARDHADLGALTTFEITAATAFKYFADQNVEIAALEVGLGGRLDATNVVNPLVAVITSISLDHTQVLGNTIAEIAREKAGIIKPDGIVVLAPQPEEALEVIRDVAQERNARLLVVGEDWKWWPRKDEDQTLTPTRVLNELCFSGHRGMYEPITVPLLGEHQLANAATAVAALEALRFRGIEIRPQSIVDGIAKVRWPGRMEVLAERPAIVADGAHNADSMQKLAKGLSRFFPGQRLILIIGTSLDKDIAGMAREIVPHAAHVVITRSEHPRSAQPESISRHMSSYTDNVYIVPNVRAALAAARELASPEDVICITGSLFVVAEAREALGITTA